jgi:hypothetical protein
MSGVPVTKPLWSYPRPERAKLAASWVGEQVTLTVNPLRSRSDGDLRRTLTGHLVCVARSGTNGTTSEIVAILTAEPDVVWYPLAIVESIKAAS